MPQRRGGEIPPPTLKNAAELSSSFEYAAIWTGQSNSQPWGFPADGFEFALELSPLATGLDLTAVVIPNNAARSVGMIEVLSVDATVLNRLWNTSTWLRLGTPTAPLKGYAKVIESEAAKLHVRWISLPTNNQTVAGYLVRENGKFASYENTRVLTPFMPWRDIQPPLPNVGGTTWTTPQHSPYLLANGTVAVGGQRLILPSPYTVPAAVTAFSDLALFLPMTRREGATGYGISDVADSTFNGTGAPTGHPILDITAGVFTFANAISATADLTGGYLLVDWEQSAATKRSWAKILSNTTTTFTPDPATWLGDGVPDDPASSTVTFNGTTDIVTWVGLPLVEGDRITFTNSGGALPTGLTAGQVYYVRNVAGNDFQVSESMDHPVVDFTGAGTGTHTGTRAWIYTAWIPHWKDNPFMWLPGPEFAYPNEDQQPRNVFVHWRARGRLTYAYNVNPVGSLTPFDGVADSRFGALLPFAWRMGSATGKIVRMVSLGIGSTPLVTGVSVNVAAGVYAGTVGWWDYEKLGFGVSLEDTTSMLSGRIKRLVTFIAPQALLAEGSAKLLRYVSACHIQGEADAFIEGGRELYQATITDYKEWLRDLVDSNGLSPFEGEAEMPFVQPLITHFPWEVDETGVITWTDIDGFVNNAIKEAHTADEFADYVLSEDLPKINSGHFSGGGMAVLGARLAAAVLDVLDHALAYTSPATTATNARLLRIANLALLHIGQGARQIASLSESTTEARLVSTMLPEATRQLLSLRQWSWAMRHEPATQVKHSNPDWLYAYVVPGRALTPIAIVPPADENTGTQVFTSTFMPGVREEIPPTEPEEFEIGRSPSGHRLLFTNVPETAGDIANQVPLPSNEMFPERLPKRPTIRYVDKVIDPDRYSESFATALTWLLASMLAPALVKGQEGDRVAAMCFQKAAGFTRTEADHESVTRQRPIEHRPTWISTR